MTLCFVARISNPGKRFGNPFYEVDVPSPPSGMNHNGGKTRGEFIPPRFPLIPKSVPRLLEKSFRCSATLDTSSEFVSSSRSSQ